VPNLKQFALPDVGEGLTEADILTWSVQPGDTVAVNQTLVEVETAKAAVELPSPFAGVVTELHAEPGATVEVGTPIITIDVGGDSPVADEELTLSIPGAAEETAEPSESATEPVAEGGRQAVLVGYGPRAGAVRRRPRKAHAATADQQEAMPTAQLAFDQYPGAERTEEGTGPTTDMPQPAGSTPSAPNGSTVLAKPPVRKLAKTLGVDLHDVVPSGPNGTISRDDVQSAASGRPARPTRPGAAVLEERLPIRGVRKHTAAAMVASAFTAPHVTEFVTVDVTAMMELRERVAARREFAGAKVSPLLFLARAVLWAARRTPVINSTWDDAAGEIVIKHYVNLGIAAATDRGLIVPNVKDADQLSLAELAAALNDLTETARAGRTTPADMAGGTITITNVGVFGVDTGTPIINPGESAIVAFGAVRRAPWVVSRDGAETIEPRWVTQLAVSFDHRVVDGQQGSEFLGDVAALLADPGLALL
jgi:2-oxoisovalerate dehydrogenase E2 component (dihydrolipoyl transacylase)